MSRLPLIQPGEVDEAKNKFLGQALPLILFEAKRPHAFWLIALLILRVASSKTARSMPE